jgi:flavin reductase (DIM6/NTAB) family NADH-FMN oxidoreductase RutF
MDPKAFRQFLGRWPTGVTILTSSAAGQPVGCTVSTLIGASYHPPLLVASLARTSSTLAACRELGRFGVNLLPADRHELVDRFATAPLAVRFDGVGHSLRDGVPILADAVGTAVCTVRELIPLAGNVLLVGEPVDCEHDATRAPLVLLGRAAHRPSG